MFAAGQAYVALSRAECLLGLRVLRYNVSSFKTSQKVREYYDRLAEKQHSVYAADQTFQTVLEQINLSSGRTEGNKKHAPSKKTSKKRSAASSSSVSTAGAKKTVRAGRDIVLEIYAFIKPHYSLQMSSKELIGMLEDMTMLLDRREWSNVIATMKSHLPDCISNPQSGRIVFDWLMMGTAGLLNSNLKGAMELWDSL
jgi:hypothetical protein